MLLPIHGEGRRWKCFAPKDRPRARALGAISAAATAPATMLITAITTASSSKPASALAASCPAPALPCVRGGFSTRWCVGDFAGDLCRRCTTWLRDPHFPETWAQVESAARNSAPVSWRCGPVRWDIRWQADPYRRRALARRRNGSARQRCVRSHPPSATLAGLRSRSDSRGLVPSDGCLDLQPGARVVSHIRPVGRRRGPDGRRRLPTTDLALAGVSERSGKVAGDRILRCAGSDSRLRRT